MKFNKLFTGLLTTLFILGFSLGYSQNGLVVEEGTTANTLNGGYVLVRSSTGPGYHLALDPASIQAKQGDSFDPYVNLELNPYGAAVNLCSGVLFTDGNNSHVGINTTSPDGPLDIDFGSTGSVVAGTPLGNGPGWIHYAANGDRWNNYASNNNFKIEFHNAVGRNLTYTKGGRLGINTITPSKMLDIYAGSDLGEGIRVEYDDISENGGAALIAKSTITGGWTVYNSSLSPAPIEASQFVMASDLRVKNSVNYIEKETDQRYLNYFDNLQTASYYYNHESHRQAPHIGIIAQSAPVELISDGINPTEKDHSNMLTVSLADWIGLNTVVIKHLREENKALKAEIQAVQRDIQMLKKQNDKN